MTTDHTTTDGKPTTKGRKPIPRYQGALNRLIRTLLRTPLVSRGIGSRLLTIEVVGRKTGKPYVVPVSYTRHEGRLLVGTPGIKWARNLRTGTPVHIRLRGRRRLADVVVHSGEDEVMRLYDVVARDNHANASFSGIGIEADGSPNRADLRQAWRSGAVVLELTPH